MKSCGKSKPLLPTTWVISGGVGLILLFLLISGIRSYYSKSSSDSSSSNDQGSSQNQNSSGQSGGATNYYPSSGSTQITETSPARAYLNPTTSWHRGTAGTKFILESNPDIICENNEQDGVKGKGTDWASLPAGNYLVYSLKGRGKVGFSWGQGTPPD
jgi:hypothetical protein